MQKVEGSSPFSRFQEVPASKPLEPCAEAGHPGRLGLLYALGRPLQSGQRGGRVRGAPSAVSFPEDHWLRWRRWLTGGPTRLADSSAAITT
jgi:hypothetical protein